VGDTNKSAVAVTALAAKQNRSTTLGSTGDPPEGLRRHLARDRAVKEVNE